MSLFDGTALITGARGKGESQVGFAFPASLSEKYRPHSLAEFVGLEKPKRVLSKFADAPFPNAAFLFVGPSGTGKTSMALALCEAIRGELHHIPSQNCNLATLEDVVRQCHYVPRNNTLHIVLVDESDQMTPAAQLAFLSKLDGTAFPPQTVFIFTANDTARLQDRFLSRCMVLQFSSHGMAKEAATLLERIWKQEAGETPDTPNFLRMVQDSKNNVRDAVNSLQVELLAL
jgi:replication-associated recombination protein RarA